MIQVANASNTSGDSTCISNELTNNNSHALVFVTHLFSGYFPDVSAVWYNQTRAQWCIFDGSYNSMPVYAQFLVHITFTYV